MNKKTALTIAGSDSSGGAGIQADLKTMHGCGVYGMSAITAITAQNTTGVKSIMKVSSEVLADELDMVFTDIFPDAVKIGMTFQTDLINVIAEKLLFYKAKNIVLDPVMIATSGARLLDEEAIEVICKKLVPLADVITPNIPEALVLLQNCDAFKSYKIENHKDMEKAAEKLSEIYNCAVLIKGGHLEKDKASSDVLCTRDRNCIWFEGKRIDTPNTHGTGCTLSSAICSYLAKGYDLENSIIKGKKYLENSIKEGLNLGKGSGPLWHFIETEEKCYG